LKRRLGLRSTMPWSRLNRKSQSELIFGIASKASVCTWACTMRSASWRAFSNTNFGEIVVARLPRRSTNHAYNSSRRIPHLTGGPCEPRRRRRCRLEVTCFAFDRPCRNRAAESPEWLAAADRQPRSQVESFLGTLPGYFLQDRRKASNGQGVMLSFPPDQCECVYHYIS
jgi:hypothetical protein